MVDDFVPHDYLMDKPPSQLQGRELKPDDCIDVRFSNGTKLSNLTVRNVAWSMYARNPVQAIRRSKSETADLQAKKPNDPVNHPKHYTSHPSGVECIQITRHMMFNIGNAIKYLWRAEEKENAIEDLQKAAWYIQDEIERRKQGESL